MGSESTVKNRAPKMKGGMDHGEPRTCPRCASPMPQDAMFCPHCGMPLTLQDEAASRQYDYYAPPPRLIVQKSSIQTAREVIRGIGAVMTLIILALVSLNVGIMLWGMGLVIPEAWDKTTSLYVALPWLVRFLSLPGLAFVIFYILLVASVLLSFVFMFYLSRKEFSRELRFLPTKHSPIYVISTLFMAVLTMNAAYYLTLGLFGIDPSSGGTAGSELWELLYSLLRASVWEEVICRILFIGLPLAVVYAVKGKTGPYRRYILGGGFQIGSWEKLFLIFSSAMFAFAHVFSWDLYKVLPTFLAGLALGYLFLKYGIYASIMLHFFIDYLSMPMEVWQGDGTDLAMGLFLLVAMIVGAVYLIYYSIRGLELFCGRTFLVWESKRPLAAYYQPMASAQPYQPYSGPAYGPSFGFVCMNCGSTEARYQEGRFVCSRCGKDS